MPNIDSLIRVVADSVHRVDSLRATKESAALDLISKADQFYNNSWNRLIWLLSIFGGIVAIVIPIIIQYFQRKQNKLNQESFEKLILEKNEKLKNDIINTKLVKLKKTAKAVAYHSQANLLNEQPHYIMAMANYLLALDQYISTDDYDGLATVLASIKGLLD